MIEPFFLRALCWCPAGVLVPSRPNVVRVGAEEAPLSAAVKAVWTEAMINRYEAMGAESWAVAYKDCEGRMANCKVYMASMAARLAEKGRGEGQQTEADSSQVSSRGQSRSPAAARWGGWGRV